MTKIIGAPTLDDALDVLREQIGEAESRGEKNLIFCEDRLTLLCERAVLDAVGGTFLTEVTTFARYLSGSASVLSKQGSVMEIGAILSACEKQLTCFGRGSAQAVYETIAQLSASRVDAEMLRMSAGETEGMLARKLCDLALIMEKYADFLREKGLVDENGYLALLPDKIASGELRNTNVFFFAFPSFTRQAQEGIRAALADSASVTGIFLAGKADLYTNEGARVFRRVCEESGGAKVYLSGASLEGDALILCNGIFSPEKFSLPPVKSSQIISFAAEDEEEELRTVAALIKKYVAEGMRYRDIAVLVSDERVFPVAEKVFGSYRIPFYAEKKRAFSAHPFCLFVLSVLEAVRDGVLPYEADAIASNPYFGNGDEYRNYLLKFGGFRGAVKREIKEGEAVRRYDRQALLSAREKMLSVLAVFPKKGKGSEYAEGVRSLFALVQGERITDELSRKFTGTDQEFLDLSPLGGILEEIRSVAGDRGFTVGEFASLLKNGLEACTVSMIPQFSDAVFVGDCTESKFARVKLLFATGLTDAVPRASADTAVISDGDIGKLSRLQVEIEPAIAQVNARAREALALNLCSFSEFLYLSYPLRKNGEETAKGEVLQYAEKLFLMRPLPDLFPYDCSEREPAFFRLLSARDEFQSGRSADTELYSSLFAALRQAGEGERAERLLSNGQKQNISCGKQLYFSNGTISPTLLERYFSCPYAGFAVSGLRLREREEKSVLATDTGTFIHAVLEQVAGKLNELSDEQSASGYAQEVARELLATPRFSSLADTDEGKYTGDRLVKESVAVSAVMYRQLAGSAFRVCDLEGAVTIPELSLYGKTDRVDESGEYVRVIDYKTGSIDDSAVGYYTGRKLQLQLYLKGVSAGKKAAGAFYFPAAEKFSKPDEANFRMSGFYNGEDSVLTLLDSSLQEGQKSDYFEGTRNGKFSDKGMSGEDFGAFLDYSVLVSAKAENEMKAGNVAPSPYGSTCDYCKLKGMCAYDGAPRKADSVKCADIVRIVKRERGDTE